MDEETLTELYVKLVLRTAERNPELAQRLFQEKPLIYRVILNQVSEGTMIDFKYKMPMTDNDYDMMIQQSMTEARYHKMFDDSTYMH